MSHSPSLACKCCSGKEYKSCCEPYHKGKNPENALLLMRSRYSAYALGLADYSLSTAKYPDNKDKILQFCNNTHFEGLDILEFIDGEKKAYVTFKATLSQNGRDASFIEKSEFEKMSGKWFYKIGVFPIMNS